jgi:hypothetical protein
VTTTTDRYAVVLDVVRANAEHGRTREYVLDSLLTIVLDPRGRELVALAVAEVFPVEGSPATALDAARGLVRPPRPRPTPDLSGVRQRPRRRG